MARRFRKRKPLDSLVDINVTPLIDLAFSLLIIFMVTTPLLEQTIPLRLPVQVAAKESSTNDPKPQTISINAKGEYYWGSDRVSPSMLEQKLQSVAKLKQEPVIHLRADATIPYQDVVSVIDLVKKYKLTKLNLDTQVQ